MQTMVYSGRVMPDQRAGTFVGKYIQRRELKTGQQKVQLYYEEGHRIINDRMENIINGWRYRHNLI